MKAGNFSINDYLEKLYENAETGIENKEGLIIPEENKKSYNWLKKEYHAGQTEVKVEMKFQGAKFEPGYDLQTDLKSVKDFKPGMYGEVKTGDNEKGKSLDSKKETPNFSKDEGEKKEEVKKDSSFKTKTTEDNIKDKEEETDNEKKPDVKKVDLKTKKTNESYRLNEISDEQLQKQIEKAKAEGRKISPEYEKRLKDKHAENKQQQIKKEEEDKQKNIQLQNNRILNIIEELKDPLKEKTFSLPGIGKNLYFVPILKIQKDNEGKIQRVLAFYVVSNEKPDTPIAFIGYDIDRYQVRSNPISVADFSDQHTLLASVIRRIDPQSDLANRKNWSSL